MNEASHVILINPFEMPSDAGASFVDEWSQVTDVARPNQACLDTCLHQALESDAPFGFVARGTWTAPGGGNPNFYRISYEHGPDPADAPVQLFNFWEIDPARAHEAEDVWRAASDALLACDGYMGIRFHEALAPDDVRFRWVSYAGWRDAAAFEWAMSQVSVPDILVGARSFPALYRVVKAAGPA
jgi:hypothetical protein